jgi:Amt family ammonium transporter
VKIDSGNTAWVLASAAMVLLMTPGLAFFYAGMVRGKNALGMLMQNFITIGIVSIVWVLASYSIAFGPDGKGRAIPARWRRACHRSSSSASS